MNASKPDQKRLPRFKRSGALPLQITDRDVEIIRSVYKHHFLTSQHIVSLASGSDQQIRRRLQLLYHHGYLERPRAQLDFFARAGSQPMVYGLANRGARLLAEADNQPYDKLDWSWKNSKVRRVFLDHTLGIADVMIAFELACREENGVTLIGQDQILEEAPEETRMNRNPHRFEATVRVKGKPEKLALVPDQVFALEHETEHGAERENFFLEVDRGTMPVERKSLRGSSIYKKLLTYYSGWQQKRHSEQYGWSRFRVLTVTASLERVENMVKVTKQLNEGRGSRLFLFTRIDQISNQNPTKVSCADGQGENVIVEIG